MSSLARHPDILWAESPALIWLTVVLPEECLYDFRLSKEKIVFEGHSKSSPDKKYAFELEFKEEIAMKDTDSRQYGYNLFLEISKKKADSFWGRLTKSEKKNIFVKTDFKRYKDPEFYDEPEFDDNLDINHLVNGMISQKKSEMGGRDVHGLPKFKIEDNKDFMRRLNGAKTEEEFQSLGEEESRLKMAFMRDAVAKQEEEEDQREEKKEEGEEAIQRKPNPLVGRIRKMIDELNEEEIKEKEDVIKKRQEVKRELERTLELMKTKKFEGKEALQEKFEGMVKRYSEMAENNDEELSFVEEMLDSLGEEEYLDPIKLKGYKTSLTVCDDAAFVNPKVFSKMSFPMLQIDKGQ